MLEGVKAQAIKEGEAGRNCRDCRNFQEISDVHGECRRYAPNPNSSVYVERGMVGEIKVDIHWPKVYHRNWCGEFAPKTEQPQAAQSQQASESAG